MKTQSAARVKIFAASALTRLVAESLFKKPFNPGLLTLPSAPLTCNLAASALIHYTTPHCLFGTRRRFGQLGRGRAETTVGSRGSLGRP